MKTFLLYGCKNLTFQFQLLRLKKIDSMSFQKRENLHLRTKQAKILKEAEAKLRA